MGKVLECDCGYVAKGDTDDEVVAAAQSHALEIHRMSFPRELLLVMARPNGGSHEAQGQGLEGEKHLPFA